MKCFRTYNLLTALLLIVFSFSSLVTCNHESSEDNSTFSTDRKSETYEATNINHPHGACNGNGQDTNYHLCPCLCHIPVSTGTASITVFACNTETIPENLPKVLIKDFFNRIERPPQLS